MMASSRFVLLFFVLLLGLLLLFFGLLLEPLFFFVGLLLELLLLLFGRHVLQRREHADMSIAVAWTGIGVVRSSAIPASSSRSFSSASFTLFEVSSFITVWLVTVPGCLLQIALAVTFAVFAFAAFVLVVRAVRDVVTGSSTSMTYPFTAFAALALAVLAAFEGP